MAMTDTKTDRILLLLQTLKDAPHSRLSEDEVRTILGNPSRASFYRLISTLLMERGNLRPLIIKLKMGEKTFYALNRQEWQQFADLDDETQFILHCMKNADHNFSHLAKELGIFEEQNIKGADQKFIHLETHKKEKLDSHQKSIFHKTIRSIINSRKILISTHKKTFDFIPLTICQYRHQLYVFGAKNEFQSDNLMAVKISDIDKMIETSNTFNYPSPAKYNPEFIYRRIQDFIVHDEEELLSYHFLNEDVENSEITEEIREKLLKKAERILEKYSHKKSRVA
jgi:hypothetical protein